MQRRGADALAPALQHGIRAAALAKLGVEPGVRWRLGEAVVDPRVNDAGAVLAGDLAALAVAETPTLVMALAGHCGETACRVRSCDALECTCDRLTTAHSARQRIFPIEALQSIG